MDHSLMIVIFYRSISLLIGLIFGFFGYRLFVLGIKAKAGDFNAAWGEKNVVLKRAAPGTFFALFGVIIISISLLKGPSIDKYYSLENADKSLHRTIVWPAIDPQILKLIHKSINSIKLNSDEKRILKAWAEKHSSGSIAVGGAIQFPDEYFGRTVVHPHADYVSEYERDIEELQTDNKANSADAKNRAAD